MDSLKDVHLNNNAISVLNNGDYKEAIKIYESMTSYTTEFYSECVSVMKTRI